MYGADLPQISHITSRFKTAACIPPTRHTYSPFIKTSMGSVPGQNCQ